MSTRRPLTVMCPWRHQLPGLGAALAEAEPMHDVVQPALQAALISASPVLPLLFDGMVEILAELPLEHAVVMLDLLLLAQVNAVVGELAAALDVHARRRFAALDRALRRVAARALEEQLQAVAAAKSTNGSSVSCHSSGSGFTGLMVSECSTI